MREFRLLLVGLCFRNRAGCGCILVLLVFFVFVVGCLLFVFTINRVVNNKDRRSRVVLLLSKGSKVPKWAEIKQGHRCWILESYWERSDHQDPEVALCYDPDWNEEDLGFL